MSNRSIFIDPEHLPSDSLCRCDNCGEVSRISELDPPDGAELTPGSEVPAGRCPKQGCGALCYVVYSRPTTGRFGHVYTIAYTVHNDYANGGAIDREAHRSAIVSRAHELRYMDDDEAREMVGTPVDSYENGSKASDQTNRRRK